MDNTLYEAAQAVLKNAYVKYSGFKVAAALQMKDGTIITGINVENASFGLSNCAERTALFTAYTKGYDKEDIETLLVTTEQPYIVSPCGACRQVMQELLTPDTKVLLSDCAGNIQELTNKELLPFAFSGDDL